jgi:hypothetical protein
VTALLASAFAAVLLSAAILLASAFAAIFLAATTLLSAAIFLAASVFTALGVAAGLLGEVQAEQRRTATLLAGAFAAILLSTTVLLAAAIFLGAAILLGAAIFLAATVFLSAPIFLATAIFLGTVAHAEHSVEKLESEALGAQTKAEHHRCSKYVPLHRAMSPFIMEQVKSNWRFFRQGQEAFVHRQNALSVLRQRKPWMGPLGQGDRSGSRMLRVAYRSRCVELPISTVWDARTGRAIP